MRMHSVLMMVVATLAIVNGSVSAAGGSNLRKAKATSSINSFNTVQTEAKNSRMLRNTDVATGENGHVYYYPTKKGEKTLHRDWYKSGFSTKKVAKELNQSENRELKETYNNLAIGYTAFVKGKQSQQQLQ
ncbi:RXLR domain-containing protein [Phytophthora infestans]|uniref:RxLR effector protein n=1 Tax=Phytophthora infestans TaxID=4787 RepID=A0A833T1R6_PHYIN|nr:RXLR domain-containing protein [Phytophthora infestans]